MRGGKGIAHTRHEARRCLDADPRDELARRQAGAGRSAGDRKDGDCRGGVSHGEDRDAGSLGQRHQLHNRGGNHAQRSLRADE